MEKVTILEFRRDAEAVIRKAAQGQSLILTHRGKPVMRLEPIHDRAIDKNDPFYAISELAVPDESTPNEPPLTNEAIDAIVYKT